MLTLNVLPCSVGMNPMRNAIPAATPVSSKTGGAGSLAPAASGAGAAAGGDGAGPGFGGPEVVSPHPAQSAARAAVRRIDRGVGTSPLLRAGERRRVALQQPPAELVRVPLRRGLRRERMDVAPRRPDRHDATLDEERR